MVCEGIHAGWPVTHPSGDISELKGLGPKSQEMLSIAGITSIQQLREMGSIEAFVLTRQKIPAVSLNLLWGLESALTGVPWQEVARVHRTSLLLALETRLKGPPR